MGYCQNNDYCFRTQLNRTPFIRRNEEKQRKRTFFPSFPLTIYHSLVRSLRHTVVFWMLAVCFWLWFCGGLQVPVILEELRVLYFPLVINWCLLTQLLLQRGSGIRWVWPEWPLFVHSHYSGNDTIGCELVALVDSARSKLLGDIGVTRADSFMLATHGNILGPKCVLAGWLRKETLWEV